MDLESTRIYHKFFADKILRNWQIRENANWEANKAIAVSREVLYRDLYDKLDIRQSKRNLHRLVQKMYPVSVAVICRVMLKLFFFFCLGDPTFLPFLAKC